MATYTKRALTQPGAMYVTAGDDISCASCGVVFWLTSQLEQARQQDHGSFYCPNGHSLSFKGETEAEKYKRQLKNSQDSLAQVRGQLDQAEASKRAWKGQATRARNLVAKGECPFCGQHLRDLKRHVDRKHKDQQEASSV
jgi:ssDNA-binding Zn-finger/Zn-ribbon topoisomerase 1